MQNLYKDLEIDGDTYYKHVIGVTVSSHHRPQTVQFWVDKYNAPYILTKPFHQSQTVIEQNENGTDRNKANGWVSVRKLLRGCSPGDCFGERAEC